MNEEFRKLTKKLFDANTDPNVISNCLCVLIDWKSKNDSFLDDADYENLFSQLLLVLDLLICIRSGLLTMQKIEGHIKSLVYIKDINVFNRIHKYSAIVIKKLFPSTKI